MGILTVSIHESTHLVEEIWGHIYEYSLYLFVWNISFTTKTILLYSLFVFLIWRIFFPKDTSFLGLIPQKKILPVYFWLLLCLVPVLFLISGIPEFVKHYPFFKPWEHDSILDLNPLYFGMASEMIYGLSFIALEWFFRGIMVIGIARFIGRRAVLPIVSVYVFYHFGKPIPEAISSLFGGMLLSIIAYYRKDIIVGCLLHIGLALMIDAFIYIRQFIL